MVNCSLEIKFCDTKCSKFKESACNDLRQKHGYLHNGGSKAENLALMQEISVSTIGLLTLISILLIEATVLIRICAFEGDMSQYLTFSPSE